MAPGAHVRTANRRRVRRGACTPGIGDAVAATRPRPGSYIADSRLVDASRRSGRRAFDRSDASGPSVGQDAVEQAREARVEVGAAQRVVLARAVDLGADHAGL